MSDADAIVHPLVCGDGPTISWDATQIGVLPFPVARIEADEDVLSKARHGAPGRGRDRRGDGRPAAPEWRHLRARLIRPCLTGGFLRRMHAWGEASVRLARARHDLLPELMIGTWTRADVGARL
jgi:hypothetical protein